MPILTSAEQRFKKEKGTVIKDRKDSHSTCPRQRPERRQMDQRHGQRQVGSNFNKARLQTEVTAGVYARAAPGMVTASLTSAAQGT